MKIYTCTPVRFEGDHTFFSRDSGLCCRGLQMIGVDSRALMPGPPMEGDEPDLIRTDYSNLESPDWWRSLGLDGLMFYSWADGRYTNIARAVKRAGIRLMVNMDTWGLISPRIDERAFWQTALGIDVRRHGVFAGPPIALVKTLAAYIPWRCDLPRLAHLEQADAIGVLSPSAAEWIKEFCRIYNRDDLASRVRMLPHPVAPYLRYDGTPKRPRVLCIGRWDDPVQKNPQLAVAAIAHVLSRKPECDAVIIGSGIQKIESLVRKANIPPSRIRILDKQRHTELVAHFNSAQISLCSSYYEGGHIVSEEALCCGCSVVAPDLPALRTFRFYASKHSGQLGGNTPETLGAALCDEFEHWSKGARDPIAISQHWCEELHADRVAGQIVKALGL
jgi:glycosyltransferase involved in cell wall biosynthesis